MSGGKIKNATSLITLNKELEQVKIELSSASAKAQLAQKSLNEYLNQKSNIEQELMESRISLAKLEPIVEAKRAKFEKLGAFRYSKEDGTPAAKIKEQIHYKTKQSRYDKLMKLQKQISKINISSLLYTYNSILALS